MPPTASEILGVLLTIDGLALYAILVVAFGLAGAVVLRFDLMKWTRKLVWFRSKSMLTPTFVWDDSLLAHMHQWILIELEDERLIQGFLHRFSTYEEPRELYLLLPRQLAFADDGTQIVHPLGQAMLLPQESIRTIRFSEIPGDMEPREGAGTGRVSFIGRFLERLRELPNSQRK